MSEKSHPNTYHSIVDKTLEQYFSQHRKRSTPDKLIKSKNEHERREFLYGISQLYSALLKTREREKIEEKKLLLIFPTRGAEPIYWALDEFSKAQELPLSEFCEIIFPPIGTGTNLSTLEESGGIDRNQKEVIILDYFETVFQDLMVKNKEGVLSPLGETIGHTVIVDEVQKGGTVSHLYPIVSRALQRFHPGTTLSVLAIQDTNVQGKQAYARDYMDLIQGKKLPAVRGEGLNLDLWFVDIMQLLPIIGTLDNQTVKERKEDGKKLSITEQRENIGNYQAEQAVRKLINELMAA